MSSIVPWGLHPLQGWVMKELERRSEEYGQNPNPTEKKPYSGPRTAWVRVFSNGKSNHPDAVNKDGFAMGGVYGFKESFGFGSDKKISIGVDAQGNLHQIPFDRSRSRARNGSTNTRPDFPHRPPPSLTSITCEMGGSSQGFPNLCRKITIRWKCFSLAQLNYMTPYFLTPRITCLVEWGWNNYDVGSLIDLRNTEELNKIFIDPTPNLDRIKKSNGNYDVGMGFIFDYGYELDESGGYNCYTTIINVNKTIEGEQIDTKEIKEKQGDGYAPIKGFKEFAEKNLLSIDSDSSEYVDMRKDLRLETSESISKRVFRITKKDSDENKTSGLWLRMDLVQDIINAFFQIEMDGEKKATIRSFDISDSKICGNPFLKSVNKNVLVPNQYAPRFTIESSSSQEQAQPRIEDAIYNSLFKKRVTELVEKYGVSKKFDNLKEAINPSGRSFPVYTEDIKSAERGYWGYLKDLFIEVEYLRKIILNQDSLLKFLEQLLQGINEALSQICQLKLISAEYGNAKYSVIDQSLPGITKRADAEDLPRIVLGALDSAYLKSAKFNVKLSSEMMSQLIFQSANPYKDKAGATPSKNVKAEPIISRYSEGDRLYELGILKTKVRADSGPTLSGGVSRDLEAEKAQVEKIKAERNEKNFFIYYKQDASGNIKKYFLYEPGKDFMNYILGQPDLKAPYANSSIMPNTSLEIQFLGISGINYLAQFVLDHAPEAYDFTNAVWQVSDVRQVVEDKNWTTTIIANVRPISTLRTAPSPLSQ